MQPSEENSIDCSSGSPAAVISLSASALDNNDEALRVFFSYAHEDEPLLEGLVKHLRPLELEGTLKLWYDHDILAGRQWAGEIEENLRSANIILLLISADFLNSDYCHEKELPFAMSQNELGKATVIPIILRNCDWQHADFARLQVLPENGQPVTSWENTDDAFTNIVLNLRRVINNRQPNKHSISPISIHPKTIVKSSQLLFGLLGLISLIVIAFFFLRLWPVPKPVPEQLESQDSLEQVVSIRYLTQTSPFPVDAPWQVLPFNGLKQRVIRGGKLGIFKDLQTNNPYNIYENFLLELDLALLRHGKLSWVVRAVDFNNFYLFELLQPDLSKQQVLLKASIWKNGHLFRDLQSQVAPIFFSQREVQSVAVTILGIGYQFKVCLRTYDDFPKYVPVGTIIDPENTYPYGGIGFFPQADAEFRLIYLHVKPIPFNLDLQCSEVPQ